MLDLIGIVLNRQAETLRGCICIETYLHISFFISHHSATQAVRAPATAPLGFTVGRSEVSQQCCRLNVKAHSAVKWYVDAFTLMQLLCFFSHSHPSVLITFPLFTLMSYLFQ